MKWFRDLPLSIKIVLALSASVLAIIILAYQSKKSVDAADERMKTVYDRVVCFGHSGDILQDAYRVRLDVLTAVNAVEARDSAARDSKLSDIDDLLSKIEERWKLFISISLTPKEKELADKFRVEWDEYGRARAVTLSAIRQGDATAARAAAKVAGSKFDVASDTLMALQDMQIELSKQRYEDSLRGAASDNLRNLLTAVVAIAFSLLLGFAVSRAIKNQVSDILVVVGRAAQGDLTTMTKADSKDEVGRVGENINRMIGSLREILGRIAEATSRLGAASQEMSATAQQAAEGSNRQKEQTEQVATAIEEMSATVLEVSDNANKAADAARKASETAQGGGSVVNEAVDAMDAIARTVNQSASTVKALGSSSDQIGEIIGVIDDIADQTNLLALNAAIEAARAGEQGRGFAVVADEVRKLAERTTKATKEIAGMIKKIQVDTGDAVRSMEEGTAQVSSGVEKVNKTGRALQDIVQMADQVGSMITQIATAATEQSSAAEQVSASVVSISGIAKETSTGAEQSAHAAQDLAELAHELESLVGQFRLKS